MSSLKEKAKTSYSICENAYLTCEVCESQNKCGSGNCPLVNVLWVRLEDAERAIEDVENQIRESIKTEILNTYILINKHKELKQKLQQLRDFWVAHIEPVDNEQPHPYFFTLHPFTKEEKLKIEELLKEER